jgi:MFS family permease
MLLDHGARADEVADVHAPSDHRDSADFTPDSRLAWVRLALALAIGSVGAVGMWSVVVVLPVVQAEFGATRGAVSLAFTLTMFGFGVGGVATGKITDRFGIVTAMALSIAFLGSAYILAGLSTTLSQFIAVYFLIGLGTSATFAPLMAEVSHWFERYRGLAVTIVASGNYVAGTIWPPVITWGIQSAGWRATHIAIGIFSVLAMTLLLLVLRAQIGGATVRDHDNAPPPRVDLKLSTNTLTALLCIASISCCVAMAMPQVHIVAYCGDLGYGPVHGAEMLSLMMAFGIVSRIGSGYLADRIGGIRTLLIGSVAQGFALLFYLFFDSLS